MAKLHCYIDHSKEGLDLSPAGRFMLSTIGHQYPHHETTVNRALKTVLLYLLMALLPLSGIAAARGSCGKVHPASMVEKAHSQCDKNSVQPTYDPVPKMDKASQLHTSATCSICLVGPAAPMANVTTLIVSASRAVDPSPKNALAQFIPSGLERPPRSPAFPFA